MNNPPAPERLSIWMSVMVVLVTSWKSNSVEVLILNEDVNEDKLNAARLLKKNND